MLNGPPCINKVLLTYLLTYKTATLRLHILVQASEVVWENLAALVLICKTWPMA